MRKLAHDEIARRDAATVRRLERHPVVAVLDDIRSLHNVGAIFRTSDAMLVDHLYLCGITGTPANRQLHRTALGAQDTVPWSHHADPMAVISRLKADGYTLAALEITDTPTPLDTVPATAYPLALIVGNEVTGVSDALVEAADLALEIPQYGAKHSLNVSVAYGIAVHTLVQTFLREARSAPSETSS